MELVHKSFYAPINKNNFDCPRRKKKDVMTKLLIKNLNETIFSWIRYGMLSSHHCPLLLTLLCFKTMEKKNVGAWIKLLTLIGTITS